MRTTLLRLSVLSLFLVPVSARAYYLETRGDTTEPTRYADGDESTADTIDVAYRVNATTFPSGVAGIGEAIDAAFATWTSAECGGVAFAAGDASDSTDRTHWTHDEGDVYVLVYFTDSDEEWSSGPAVGHFWFGYDPVGALIGATVVLNSRDHAWATDGATDALDVQSIVTALIGRSLGITSAMEGNATFPRYAPGDVTKRELGDDDRAALAYLYPVDGCDAPPAPEATCDGSFDHDMPCPPRPETMPGDAGTLVPGDDDAGPIGVADGGVSGPDAGNGGATSGGCSAGLGGSRAGLGWVLGVAAIAALVRRRRR